MSTSIAVTRLSRPTCEALLATQSVGQLAVIVDGKRHVLAVDYVSAGATIVCRTDDDTVLTEAGLRSAGFVAAGFNEIRQVGWCVRVDGFAREITDAVDPGRQYLQLAAAGATTDSPPRWFKIVPVAVRGRSDGPSARRYAAAVDSRRLATAA